MKKQVRRGVFETNSSSTHSICIAKDSELDLPQKLHFEFGEFGWECRTFNSMTEKASYLYTGLIDNNRKEDWAKIFELLKSKGIEVTAEEPIYVESEYTKGYIYVKNGGYVDHANELHGFLDAVCGEEKKLMDFLFSPLSFIITGNDNDEEDVDINVSYPHDEYYKGN